MIKIMVVDNSPELCVLFDTLLTINGFECETVDSQNKVHNSLSSFKPDLIILDVRINGIDGRELCKEIRLKNAHKHIPIILASTNTALLQEYDGCEADDHIEKPFEIAEVLAKINRLLGKTSALG